MRTRFAPSPTGKLHVGGLRTAIISYCFATGPSRFSTRIEDTDRERSEKQYEKEILEGMAWAELPVNNFFRQSDRHWDEIYKRFLSKIPHYKAYDSPEELQEMREQMAKEGISDRRYVRDNGKNEFTLPYPEIKKRKQFEVVRYRADAVLAHSLFKQINERTDRTLDLIRDLKMQTENLDDFVLLKSDGWPTYHLASIVDDIATNVALVVRGEEWISSLEKHVSLLYHLGQYNSSNGLAYQFCHLPLILNPDGSKMSKRKDLSQGGVPCHVSWYKEKGYSPQVLINYLMSISLSGFDPEEFLSLNAIRQNFYRFKVSTTPSKFNLEHLDNLQKKYLNKTFFVPEKMYETKKLIQAKLSSECQIDRKVMSEIEKEVVKRILFENEHDNFVQDQFKIEKTTSLTSEESRLLSETKIEEKTIKEYLLESKEFFDKLRVVKMFRDALPKDVRRQFMAALRKLFMGEKVGVPVDHVLGINPNTAIEEKFAKV